MSRRSSRNDSATGDLFAIPRAATQTPGSMDYRGAVSHLVSDMLADARAAGLDRYEVATRASRLAGRDVSKAMLDGYTSDAREEFNIPLWLAAVLESVCGSTVLADWHASVIGGRLLIGAENLDAEIGRLERQRQEAAERIRALKDISKRIR